MTNPQVTPQTYGNKGQTPDLFGYTAQFSQRSEGGPRYRYKVSRAGPPGMYKWELIQYDFRGGLNKQTGDYDRDFDRLASSTIDTRFERTAVLPLLTTAATTPDPTGNIVGIHHARVFNTLVIGMGSAANSSLFKETSKTDPTIAAISYSPSSNITCLHPININGATTAEMLLVGRTGASPQVLSDASGTVNATGHADFNPCWGIVSTFTNDDLILFYADNGIYALDRTQAITAAPTLTLSNIPDGGFAIGLHTLGNTPYRCYWAFPKQDNTTGVLAFTAEADFDIVSTNVEGFDPVPLKFDPYLTKVTWASIYRQGIVASDGFRVIWHTGTEIIDTGIFEDPIANSDVTYRIRGAWVIGGDLYARCATTVSTNGVGTREYYTMWFDPAAQAWHRVSEILSAVGETLPLNLANGLQHYWAMEGAAGASESDLIGSTTLSDTNTVGTGTGKVGSARTFAVASSQRLTAADAAAIELGNNDFTITGWLNATDATPASNMSVIAKYESTGNQKSFRVLLLTTGRMLAGISTDGSTDTQVSPTLVLSDATWYFFALRYDKTTGLLELSINGNFSGSSYASTTITSGVFNGTGILEIGASDTGSLFFGGSIDEIGWWGGNSVSRKLTNTEISYLYDAGAANGFSDMVQALPGGQGLPWSDQTEFMHTYEQGSWLRQRWAHPGVNTFTLQKTSGATATTGKQFAASGTLTTPLMELPGLEGKPKVISRITFLGDLESGDASDNTTPASVTVTAGGITETFLANHNQANISEAHDPSRAEVFDKFQASYTITQGSGGTDPTRYTPNLMPIKFEGYAWEPDLPVPSIRPRLARR